MRINFHNDMGLFDCYTEDKKITIDTEEKHRLLLHRGKLISAEYEFFLLTKKKFIVILKK